MKSAVLIAGLVCVTTNLIAAEPTGEQKQFQNFVRNEAAQRRATDAIPVTQEDWLQRKAEIRRGLEDIWNFPETRCPLEPKKLGEEHRDGYRFEKWIFQTMPGVWMTAFAYVPDGQGPFPAILQVHGHWKGAKQDPTVQARCIGAAKLGFFVLAVDAFGAGERGLTKNLGEYHGEMVGATLFPIGRPLSGIQVYENMRAVDYLQSRPEVDPKKIGITGASGGGNQSMYAGCFDERIQCIVPCCSVGTYDSYLTAACCMCEVVPSGLALTEEWGVLSLAAPRGLMVINATQDAFQFSVGEANKSLRKVSDVFTLMGQPAHLRHDVFFWKHDYSRSMREAMYGWMTYHLKGEGDGAPISEPQFETFDPETIRCFPHNSRPSDWLTLPQFAAREGRQLLAQWKMPTNETDWKNQAAELRTKLMEKTFGEASERFSSLTSPTQVTNLESNRDPNVTTFSFDAEPEGQLRLHARWEHPQDKPEKTTIVLNLEGSEAAQQSPLGQSLHDQKANFVTVDLRATGASAWPNDRIARAVDHNTAQWAMWIDHPLLGQWTADVFRLIEALNHSPERDLGEIVVVGQGPAGVVALCAAALEQNDQIQHVITQNTLVSYITDAPYEGQRVGILAPGIVRDVGDIPHLAAMALKTRVTLQDGVSPTNVPLSAEDLRKAYAVTSQIADLTNRKDQLEILVSVPTRIPQK